MGKKKGSNQALKDILMKAREKGIEVRLERLEAGGIRPKDGICIIKGEKSLFLDNRRPIREIILCLKDYIKDQ